MSAKLVVLQSINLGWLERRRAWRRIAKPFSSIHAILIFISLSE